MHVSVLPLSLGSYLVNIGELSTGAQLLEWEYFRHPPSSSVWAPDFEPHVSISLPPGQSALKEEVGVGKR